MIGSYHDFEKEAKQLISWERCTSLEFRSVYDRQIWIAWSSGITPRQFAEEYTFGEWRVK